MLVAEYNLERVSVNHKLVSKTVITLDVAGRNINTKN